VFWTYLLASIAILISALITLLRSCLNRSRSPKRPVESHTIPEWAFRQPDPLIYSQYWLKSQGLAYTWNNPDIRLELSSAPGMPIDVHALAPDTDYRLSARVWNSSPDAPVAQLPVEVSYLDFGMGAIPVPIATTAVDLPAKGAPGTPAIATVEWRTPATPGHYCIQVRLMWPFDANPDNNLGQHNVDVKALNSPRASFIVPVQNPSRRRLTIRFKVDAYELPPPRPCPPAEEQPEGREERRRRMMAVHGADGHPIPEGWHVDLGEAREGLMLEPGASDDVNVAITAPDGFSGRKSFNLNAIAGPDMIGGVTLVVTSGDDA
jgi:hypothetical protein